MIIVVLNYVDGKIHLLRSSERSEEQIEQLLIATFGSLSDLNWMYTDNLDVIVHGV